MKTELHPKEILKHLSEVFLFVNNIFGTRLDLVKQDTYILSQYAYCQQLHSSKENNRSHNRGPTAFGIAETI